MYGNAKKRAINMEQCVNVGVAMPKAMNLNDARVDKKKKKKKNFLGENLDDEWSYSL